MAGISSEYVARLEQGRARPSAQVCGALARSLELSPEETAHLMRLAGFSADPDLVPTVVPAGLRRVVDELRADPVAIYDACWRLLYANGLFAATFGDPSQADDDDRNAMIVQFETRNARVRQTADEREFFEESLVSDLRATSARYPRDPAVAALVSRLSANERFLRLWLSRAVDVHEHAHKTAVHPELGEIPLDASILATQHDDLRVVVMTPRPGSAARSKLDVLRADDADE